MYEYLDEKEKEYFKTLFKKRLNNEEIEWIKSKITPAIKKSYKEAITLANEGIKNIDNPELKNIMLKLIDRKF